MKQWRYDGGLISISLRLPKGDKEFMSLVEGIKAIPGRRFVPETKTWTCPPTKVAIEALEFLGIHPDQESAEKWKALHSPSAGPLVVVSDEHRAKLLGAGFRPYQVEAVDFVERRGGRAIIADPMGVGKTLEAIGYAIIHPEERPVLVTCPATPKLNWEREIKRWAPGERVHVIFGRTPYHLPPADWYVINYDLLGRQVKGDETPDKSNRPKRKKKKIVKGWWEVLAAAKPRIVIADEFHRIANKEAARTVAFRALVKGVSRVIGLTGTPIRNRPRSFFPILNIIAPKVFANEWRYLQRYCGPQHNGFGWEYRGVTNAEELHQLVSPLMIRRSKKELLPELPPKFKCTVPMELAAAKRADYQMREADFLESDGNSNRAQFSALRMEAWAAKEASALAWVEEYLDASDGKLVIFAFHLKILDAIERAFPGLSVRIDGSTPVATRQANVDIFQEKDSPIRLFIGQIGAAGESITLTAAEAVAFAELPLTPGELEQAEDRIHRFGQTADGVCTYFLVAPGTIDDDIAAMLLEKAEVAEQILSGQSNNTTLFSGDGDPVTYLKSKLLERKRK